MSDSSTIQAATAQEAAEIQHSLTTAGQRRVNLIWEVTQAIIALMLVLSAVVVWMHGAITGRDSGFPDGMAIALGTVVGFYFSRTNHSAIGGVGTKPPPQEYQGR